MMKTKMITATAIPETVVAMMNMKKMILKTWVTTTMKMLIPTGAIQIMKIAAAAPVPETVRKTCIPAAGLEAGVETREISMVDNLHVRPVRVGTVEDLRPPAMKETVVMDQAVQVHLEEAAVNMEMISKAGAEIKTVMEVKAVMAAPSIRDVDARLVLEIQTRKNGMTTIMEQDNPETGTMEEAVDHHREETAIVMGAKAG